jgi:hypothetical protein
VNGGGLSQSGIGEIQLSWLKGFVEANPFDFHLLDI